MTAFASPSAIVLAHTEIDEKSNEIPAAEQMIRDLGLCGVVFTADAMHCQETFEAARESGNFLIAQVKTNQQTLLDAIETIAAADASVDTSLTIDKKRHGRFEHRLGSDWGDLIKTAVRVTRHTWRKDTKTGLWKQTSETAFYASQISLDAATIGDAIRQNWGIENRNHYVRDVSFFEDQSRIRNKPGHCARLRTFALNIMRANQTKNVSRELYINALNPNHAMSYAVT